MQPDEFQAYQALCERNPLVKNLNGAERELVSLAMGSEDVGESILRYIDEMPQLHINDAVTNARAIYSIQHKNDSGGKIAESLKKPVWLAKPDHPGYRLLVERIQTAGLCDDTNATAQSAESIQNDHTRLTAFYERNADRLNFETTLLPEGRVPPPNNTSQTARALVSAVGKIKDGVVPTGSLPPGEMQLLNESLLARENPNTGEMYLTKLAVGDLLRQLQKQHPTLAKNITLRDGFIESSQQFMTGDLQA